MPKFQQFFFEPLIGDDWRRVQYITVGERSRGKVHARDTTHVSGVRWLRHGGHQARVLNFQLLELLEEEKVLRFVQVACSVHGKVIFENEKPKYFLTREKLFSPWSKKSIFTFEN